ncbi:MAG: LuxR C-terminal-related transcriptional regulator [Dehalococcoidia bacterium]
MTPSDLPALDALRVAIVARLPGRRQAIARLARDAGLDIVAVLPFAPAESGAIVTIFDGEPPEPAEGPAVVLGADSRPASASVANPGAWLSADPPPRQLLAAVQAVAAGLVVHDPLHRAHEPSDEPLTPRELDVLRCLADGDANRAIALRLGISENTVKFHVASILAKLSAQSRADAVMRAVQRGLLPV